MICQAAEQTNVPPEIGREHIVKKVRTTFIENTKPGEKKEKEHNKEQ